MAMKLADENEPGAARNWNPLSRFPNGESQGRVGSPHAANRAAPPQEGCCPLVHPPPAPAWNSVGQLSNIKTRT